MFQSAWSRHTSVYNIFILFSLHSLYFNKRWLECQDEGKSNSSFIRILYIAHAWRWHWWTIQWGELPWLLCDWPCSLTCRGSGGLVDVHVSFISVRQVVWFRDSPQSVVRRVLPLCHSLEILQFSPVAILDQLSPNSPNIKILLRYELLKTRHKIQCLKARNRPFPLWVKFWSRQV